jgi:uncharacterized protein HemX
MKEKQIDFELPQDHKKKLQNKMLTSALIGAAFVGAIFFAGMQYQKTHTEERLPANEACLAYATAVEESLKTFPVVDGQKIVDLKNECAKQETSYSVVLKEQK